MKKLIIIDEYFVNKSGHFYEYNKSVKEIFEARHIDAVIYANKKLEPQIQAEIGAIPRFDGLHKNALNKIPLLGPMLNRMRFWASLYSKLSALYRNEKEPGTVFFFTTIVWYNVLPVALAAAKSRHKSILLYRLSIRDHGGLSPTLSAIADKLYRYSFKKLKKRNNILFCTDSDVIASECNEQYSCHMKVLPIPHIKELSAAPQADMQKKTGKIRVYAPGAIREEKGIEFITRSFEYMHEVKHPLLDQVELVTQYNEAGDQQLNTSVKERLGKLRMSNIFLGNLSSEAYNETLEGADIILIPYSIEHGYRARTSGIMSETIAVCKPFITTADSWMSVQSAQYKTGLSVPYNNVEAFAEALSDLAGNYAAHQKNAVDAKAAWLAFHSQENFYRIIHEGLSELP